MNSFLIYPTLCCTDRHPCTSSLCGFDPPLEAAEIQVPKQKNVNPESDSLAYVTPKIISNSSLLSTTV